MARTVNPTLHTVRRDAFLDVAQRLVQTKGYEAMSIQDVLGELEASKGAFYHYFDSKQALLEAVVERFADGAMASLAPILNDPDPPALTKPGRGFCGIATLQATDLFIARQAGTVSFEMVQRAVAANTEAFERILGIPKGSVTLTDEPTLRLWFG